MKARVLTTLWILYLTSFAAMGAPPSNHWGRFAFADYAADWAFDGYAYLDSLIVYGDELVVVIDIKPGSDPNSINPASKQKVAVAVLTTDAFDATQIDVSTGAFGPGGAAETHGRAHFKDVDEDGDADFLLHFNTQETGIACGDTEATLTGETFDGQAIEGTDSIVTTNCP